MKPYLKTKTLLVSLAVCGAVQLMATAEAHEASARKGGELTTNTTTLLAQTRLNRLSESETKDLLNRLDKNTRDFQKSLDEILDDSRLNDSDQEDKINSYLKDFRASVKRLRDRYSRNNTFAREDMQEVLDRAIKIDNLVNRSGNRNNNRTSNNRNTNNNNSNNGNLRQDWQDVRADLDILARSSYGRGTSYNRR